MLRQACERAMEALDLEATAALLTREHGKVLVESLFDVATTAGMVGALAPLVAEALEPRSAGTSVVEQVAHGVVAAILPFNWPAAVMGNKILPALLAGNTVVVKTPPAVPARCWCWPGPSPPGCRRACSTRSTGPRRSSVPPWSPIPGVDMVSFTGGHLAGRSVLAACARGCGPRCSSSGATIRPSSGPTWSLRGAGRPPPRGCLHHLGPGVHGHQAALCAGRPPPGVARGLGGAAGAGGGGRRPRRRGDHGAGAHRGRPRPGRGLIADGATGATEVVRPATVAAPGRGWMVSPALVVAPDPGCDLVPEEQFAPALPLLPYDQVDQAVAAANDTGFGLCASVWSGDDELAGTVARQLAAGTVWTNAHGMGAMDHLAPMGGWGDSGIGMELGVEGMAAFTRPRVQRRGTL